MFSELSTSIQAVLSAQFGVNTSSIQWTRPSHTAYGDIASSIALQVAKEAKKSPQEIAEVLVQELSALACIEKVEVAGPGYINVWLTPSALLEKLSFTREACTPKVTRKEQPVIVEYSQPNIAKPLGVHHLLTTVIGQAVSNLYEHAGYPVLRWNYLGDWGTQFGKLAVAMEKWGEKKPASDYTLDELLDLYVRFHEEAEKDPSLEDAGREAFKKLEQGDESLRAFWEDIVSVTKSALGSVYERLHVHFDLDLGESFYEDKMDSVFKEGEEKGVFIEGKEGALIVEFPEESNLPPYMVRKGDGATLYSTRDIAQMRYRVDTYNPQAIYILTDIAQKLHFEQLVATCNQLQWELPAFENVLVGRMRFADKSMSTRKGNILKLEEVLDEAVRRADTVIASHEEKVQTDDAGDLAEMMGIGSVAYGILSQNRKMNLVFDWDKMLSFDGNSAPYIQYTHARARSVLRKGESSGSFASDIAELTESERSLINTLLQFHDVLQSACDQRMPHLLTQYLFELCQSYNSFYNVESILQAEESLRKLRLALTELTADVLHIGAELLTIRVPERM